MRISRIFIAIFCLSLLPGVCYAAPYNFATGMPWDSVFVTIGRELTGPIPQIFATVAMVMAGIMLMYGETGGMFKKSLQLVFGISLALHAGDWVTTVMHGVTVANNSAAAIPSVPAVTANDFLSIFINAVKSTCMAGAAKVSVIALLMLGIFAVLEITMHISLNLDQDHIKYIFKETLKIGFFAFLVMQWVGGTYDISSVFGRSFEELGTHAAGVTDIASADGIVANGFQLIKTIWDSTMELGWGSIGLIFANIIVMVGVVLCVFFMAIEIVVCKVEMYIIAVLSIPLIPFGIFKHTKFLFEKVIGALFSTGIKLMVLSFIAPFCAMTLINIAKTNVAAAGDKSSSLSVILSVLLACLVLYQIIKKAPELAQGLLSGSPSLSGGGMMQSAQNAAVTTGKLAAGGIGILGAAAAMTKGGVGGGSGGGGGMGGMAKGMAQNLGRMATSKMASPFTNAMSSALNGYENMTRMQDHLRGQDSQYFNPYDPHKFGGGGRDNTHPAKSGDSAKAQLSAARAKSSNYTSSRSTFQTSRTSPPSLTKDYGTSEGYKGNGTRSYSSNLPSFKG